MKKRTLKSKSEAAKIRSERSNAYENYDAASMGMKLPPILIQISKGMNADGFRGSRIYPDEFLPWLKKNYRAVLAEMVAAESKDEADARVARVRADGMEFNLAVRRRQFIATVEVSQVFTRAIVAVKSKMLAIPSSLAPRLAITNDPEDCAAMIKKEVVTALTELSKVKWNKT